MTKMDAYGHHRGVKRRRADGERTGPLPARSMSNLSSSSTSSDILVASAHPSTHTHTLHTYSTHTHPRPTNDNTMPVTAVVIHGRLVVRGIPGDMLTRLNDRDTRPDSQNIATGQSSRRGERFSDDAAYRRATFNSFNDNSALNDDDEGPNHKGTYSKTHILKHPETQWVHRGQGRYLPISALLNQEPNRSRSAFTSRTKLASTARSSGRSSLRRQSGDVDMSADDDADHHFISQKSLPSKRPSDASYLLRRRQSEVDPLTPGELRSARRERRSGQLASFGYDDDPEADSEDEDNRTYTRFDIETMPEFDWRHVGNGYYKKRFPPVAPVSPSSSRRGSNRSYMKDDSESQDAVGPKRFHSSELSNYPSDTFIHCGNGWYRRDSTGQALNDQSAIESSDDEPQTDPINPKFSKEELIAYKNLHPDAEFIHKGNGRYVLNDDFDNSIPSIPATASNEHPGQTYSKSYVMSHPNEPFYHAGSGRWRRGSRPTRTSESRRKSDSHRPLVDDANVSPNGLVNKQYVLQHPELEFHHRGQGRYAFGPRPQETPAVPAPPAPMRVASPTTSDAELVDTAYVKAHPNETFHHRGQGRWARGLPPPGSSNKTAVRGPLATQTKPSTTPSQPPAEDLPGLDELVIRSEGPDKFPALDWVYRGGGKWARTPKKKEPAVAKPSRARTSRGRNTARHSDLRDDWGADEEQDFEYSDDDYQAINGDGFQEAPQDSHRSSMNPMEAAARVGLIQGSGRSAFTLDDDDAQRPNFKRSRNESPRPERVTLEVDRLSDEENYPALYASAWPAPSRDEPVDKAARLMRSLYKPLNSSEKFINALTRRDPATRPKEVLQATTDHMSRLLRELQDEYLELDKITAPHARIARKPARGGRVPVDDAVYEDKKEADLYDYTFDSRKIGFQNPELQKIVRDAEGRELRKRRRAREAIETEAAATPGGEENAALAPRRAVKPVSRFDAIATTSTRKKRTTTGAEKAASETPDPTTAASGSQSQVLPGGYVVRKVGRWKNHIPKRIRELRGDSVNATQPNGAASATVDEGAARSDTPGAVSDSPTLEGSPGPVRKGRPKGSKNLHKRRDAGIPKGPRKPKVVASIESTAAPPAPSAPFYRDPILAQANPFGGFGGRIG